MAANTRAAEAGRQAAPPGDPEVIATLGIGRGHRARRWVWRILVLAVLLAAGVGVYVWQSRTRAEQGPAFITASVEQADLRETVIATGTLSPLDAVEVGAEVTGRVLKVHVDVNDPVKEGQVIVELDTQQLAARLEESQAQQQSAQASYSSAKATVQEAEATAKRKRELHARGLTSDQDLEAAEAALNRAKASVQTSNAQIGLARAGVKTAESNKSKGIIRSPIDGTVLARTVEVGQTVTAGFQTPILLTLGRDLTKMQLMVDVDEADVGKVKEGQDATFVVDAYPKQRFASKVVRLSNMPKAETTVITYEAELTVDNKDRLLRPGMTATATIVTSERKDVLSVPNAALRFEPPASGSATARAPAPPGLPIPGMGGGMRRYGGGGTRSPKPGGSAGPAGAERGGRDAVWVVDGRKVSRVAVETGATDGKRTEVSGAGVGAGMQVAIDVAEPEE